MYGKKISKERNGGVFEAFNLQESRGGVSYFKEGCGVEQILKESMVDYVRLYFFKGRDVGVCAKDGFPPLLPSQKVSVYLQPFLRNQPR